MSSRNARWRARYEAGESIAEIAGESVTRWVVRAGIQAAGGRLRTRAEALALHNKRMGLQRKRLLAADDEAELSPRAVNPFGFSRRRRGRIVFEAGEQERLIEEALAAGRVTAAPAAFAVASQQSRNVKRPWISPERKARGP